MTVTTGAPRAKIRATEIVMSISRRELLQALGISMAVGSRVAFGQEPGRGQAPRDTTPLVPPFEATGWKTVWLDQYKLNRELR